MWVVAVMLVMVGTLLALAMGARWLNSGEPARAEGGVPPDWLTTEMVRATSGDGMVIRARVALDVPDADTRALIRSRPAQVAMAMQIGAAAYEVGDDEGAQRVEALSNQIEDQLNKYLVANRVAPVRDVVVQDLVLRKP